jgi:hypothetical protein
VDRTEVETSGTADRAVERAISAGGVFDAGGPIRVDQDREASNAEHRGEVASLIQASPRQSISTKTLRMVNEP